MVTFGVDEKINLTPLPTVHREKCLMEAYENLEPEETLQAIDDFDPEWMREFLEDEFGFQFKNDDFVVEKSAGRYVVYLRKSAIKENE